MNDIQFVLNQIKESMLMWQHELNHSMSKNYSQYCEGRITAYKQVIEFIEFEFGSEKTDPFKQELPVKSFEMLENVFSGSVVEDGF